MLLHVGGILMQVWENFIGGECCCHWGAVGILMLLLPVKEGWEWVKAAIMLLTVVERWERVNTASGDQGVRRGGFLLPIKEGMRNAVGKRGCAATLGYPNFSMEDENTENYRENVNV